MRIKLSVVLLLAVLAGCASAPRLPVCAALSMSAVETAQGVYFMMTSDQMQALIERMVQLEARKCRLRGEGQDA